MIYVGIFFSVILVPFLIAFFYLSITEYKPKKEEDAIVYKKSRDKEESNTMSVVTYNIAHATHDKSRRSDIKLSVHFKREKTYDNLIQITNTIKEIDSDFVLLQEVDHDTTLSFKVNQIEYLTSSLVDYNSSFAYNYNSKYVPFPINNPVGGMHSGLLTLSKYKFDSSKRFQLHGHEQYPKSIFFLKRCMIINEYSVKKNKKLYIINIHVSSYDRDNLFKTEQFFDMLEYIERLYDSKQNYIVVGGDFNYILDDKEFEGSVSSKVTKLPDEFKTVPFKAVTDIKFKTNHGSDGYMHSVDGFIVSNNVKIVSCTTINDDFEHSNHQPVKLEFTI